MEQAKRISFQNDKQFNLVGKHIDFPIRFAKDISDGRNIIHIYEANPNNANIFYFLYFTDQEVQLRFVKRDDIKQLQDIDDLSQSQILKKSNVHVYKGKKYFFQMIQKIDKKFLPRVNQCLIGFTFEGNQKPTILFELTTEDRMNRFFDKMNEAIKKSKQYIKKHQINYLGLQQNIRRIVEKILLNSFPKRQVYNRILAKMNQKNFRLGIQQNRMLILAIVGNSQQMQNFLRKQKIEAYDLQKKKYQHMLKEEALTNVTGVLEPSSEHILEGYSEKRKLDGVVIKKLTKAEHKDITAKAHQQLFHDQIPFRSEIQIDELVGIQILNSGKIQEQVVEKNLNIDEPQIEPLKIPVRETNYSIICNDNVQMIKRDNTSIPEYFSENVEGVAVEAVKFLYQLMKVNAKQKAIRQVIQGPFDSILELVKDILTQCQKKDDKKMQQNKSIIQMLNKARQNYLKYRKNSIKYY